MSLFTDNMPALGAQHIAEAAVEDEQQRLKKIRAAVDAYDGIYPSPLNTPWGNEYDPLLPFGGLDVTGDNDGQLDCNVIVNLAQVVIDTGVSFLFGKPISFRIKGSPTQQTEDETWLAQCWEANEQDALLLKVAAAGGKSGDVFLKIISPNTAEGDVFPRIVLLDTATVNVRWQTDDLERVTRYAISTRAIDEHGRPRFLKQVIERLSAKAWTMTDLVSDDGVAWRKTGSTTWNYPFPPIVHCQNLPVENRYYGKADLDGKILHLVDRYNFIASNIMAILYYNANPQGWAKGLDGNKIERDPKSILILGEDGEMHNLEMESDLSSSLAFLNKLESKVYELAQIPEIALGKMEGLGQISGITLDILYRPLVDRTKVKRVMYGGMLKELSRRLLVIGRSVNQPVEVVWPDILPRDMLAQRQAFSIDLKNRVVSRRTVMGALGYDIEQEMPLIAKDEEEAQQRQVQAQQAAPNPNTLNPSEPTKG